MRKKQMERLVRVWGIGTKVGSVSSERRGWNGRIVGMCLLIMGKRIPYSCWGLYAVVGLGEVYMELGHVCETCTLGRKGNHAESQKRYSESWIVLSFVCQSASVPYFLV